MKRFKLITVLILLVAFLSSCYSVKISGPYDKKVELASKTDNLPYKERKTNWYFLFGLVPLSADKAEKTIVENGLTKVRVQTKVRFIDFIISEFTGIITIVTNTTIIEGARE